MLFRSEEIEGLIAEHTEAPHLRVLQKRLAKEVTVMVHSEEDYNAAVEASGILFGNATSDALKKLDEQTLPNASAIHGGEELRCVQQSNLRFLP